MNKKPLKHINYIPLRIYEWSKYLLNPIYKLVKANITIFHTHNNKYITYTKATDIKVKPAFLILRLLPAASAIHNFNFSSTRSEIFIPET